MRSPAFELNFQHLRFSSLAIALTLVALVSMPASSQAAFIDWTGVNGDGVYAGTEAGVGWTLSVSNARSAAPTGSDPTLLSVSNFAGQAAIYNLVFSQSVVIDLFNDAATNIGGLAGAGGKQETVTIIGGVGSFTLVGNGANITPSSGSVAVDAVISTAGADLIANRVNGVNHAYYLAQSIGSQTSITWQQSDVLVSGELWRVNIVPEPATGLLLGVGLALLARRGRNEASRRSR